MYVLYVYMHYGWLIGWWLLLLVRLLLLIYASVIDWWLNWWLGSDWTSADCNIYYWTDDWLVIKLATTAIYIYIYFYLGLLYVEVNIGLLCLHCIMMAHAAYAGIADSLGPVTLFCTDYGFLVDCVWMATSSTHTTPFAFQPSGSLCLFTFKPDTWVINSGATHYMTGNSKLLLYFHSITPTSSHPVIFDDGSQTYHWYEEYTHKLISFPFNYSAFTSLTKTTYYLLTPWIRLSFVL